MYLLDGVEGEREREKVGQWTKEQSRSFLSWAEEEGGSIHRNAVSKTGVVDSVHNSSLAIYSAVVTFL